MKKRILKIIKRLAIWILLAMIGGIIYSFGVATYENIRANQLINSFKNRSTYEYEVVIKDEEALKIVRKYYKVSRETSYENDGKNVFNDPNKMTLGQKGDIFMTQQSPFPTKTFIHPFITYYFGGHAAIYNGEGGYYESVGMASENIWDVIWHDDSDSNHNLGTTVDLNTYNYWQLPSDTGYYYGKYYRSQFMGVRYKYATEQQLEDLMIYLDDKVERKSLYNYLFFLDMTNKYYCTDLVSRAYSYVANGGEEVRYANRLNDDGFITSVNDILLSNDTYLTFYVEITQKDKTITENYYYLEDVNY